MATPPVGNTPKVTPIKATYYPVPKPLSPMARRMSLVERIKRAAFNTPQPKETK